MRIPSVATMVKHGIADGQASGCRKLMLTFKQNCGGADYKYLRLRQCLEGINTTLGGFGIESIPQGHNQKSPAIDYVNMGDTYDTTIMFINGNFVVGNWGYYVERGNYD